MTNVRQPFAGWKCCGKDADCSMCLDGVYHTLNKQGADLPAEAIIDSIGTFSCLSESLLSYLRTKVEKKSTKVKTSRSNKKK